MSYPTLWRTRTPSIWDDLFNVRSEFDRLIEPGIGPAHGAWAPAVDIEETEADVQVRAELPGLSSDDVTVTVENGVLTIAGEKKRETSELDQGSYHVVERAYGRFARSFKLPRSVDSEEVDAKFLDGVLTVTLAKAEAAKPRQIAIKTKA